MATFPTLKTGAVAQYPLGRGVRYSTQAVRFLDGSQQKFRSYGVGLRRWTVKLEKLDETELGAVISFVEQQQGAVFAFADPATGDTAANCVIHGDQFDAAMTREFDGQITILIEEVA